MGRVKLKIKKLENTNGRQATYAKRKHGIMKKANELSILCDIDIILLMFSPTGKPSLCNGKRRCSFFILILLWFLFGKQKMRQKYEIYSNNQCYYIYFFFSFVLYTPSLATNIMLTTLPFSAEASLEFR